MFKKIKKEDIDNIDANDCTEKEYKKIKLYMKQLRKSKHAINTSLKMFDEYGIKRKIYINKPILKNIFRERFKVFYLRGFDEMDKIFIKKGVKAIHSKGMEIKYRDKNNVLKTGYI
jgi:hypothetical protein